MRAEQDVLTHTGRGSTAQVSAVLLKGVVPLLGLPSTYDSFTSHPAKPGVDGPAGQLFLTPGQNSQVCCARAVAQDFAFERPLLAPIAAERFEPGLTRTPPNPDRCSSPSPVDGSR